MVLAVVLLIISGVYAAEEYRLGADDIIEVRFWQDPSLNANVKVGIDGKVNLDIIGSINAAGKTIRELETDIIRFMSRLNSQISQVTVRVMDFQYQHIFVKGQILSPGKHAFEEIPDLWTIINEAGGVTEFGDLSRVTIIRGGKDAGKVEIINVFDAIESGKLGKLPKIRRQDTIEIPRTPAGLPSGEISQQTARRNVIYVIGAVTTPGPLQFQENTDLLDALALAGGPTAEADLKNVRVISKDSYYAQTFQVDLEKYTKTGTPARYIMKKEDTFLIPHRSAGFLGVGLPTIAAFLGAISTAIIVYDRLTTDDGVTVTTAP